ncbi:bacterioferritin-associated ferredoxin [Andreprevotia lacus DSM 23236]|jgi:bacterioferritin-associated ferredoxin|uniref:Bacterioferritin-associated ferredoxin n=1 Tax=Andreprevotia lacus DSM 23236 TaxID=1121001 RepID=A0A1W1XLR1_9NEIS|nr:bacterioferritin-associated ferredoxin [Andreprevotia lacus]SMC24920.1 bacterioferritin-associated ferredoxin [Andreprevotia lacus DSM 23236]
MYVCVCNGVTDRDIRKAVGNGVRTFKQLQQATEVATCCGKCAGCAREVMDEALQADRKPVWSLQLQPI